MKMRLPFLDKQVTVIPVQTGGSHNRMWVTNNGVAAFEYEVEITAAQLIAGAVDVIPDKDVPKGCKIFLTDYQFLWGNAAFGGATDVRLSDKNAAPVDFVTVLVANTVNIFHRLSASVVAQVGVTQNAALITMASLGGTVDKGLQIRTTGAAATLGSTFRVRVRGYFQTA